MSVLDYATDDVINKAYEIYKNVTEIEKITDIKYNAKIKEDGKEYNIQLNTRHPMLSTCDCNYSKDGNICSHIIALHFNIKPIDLE